MRPTSSRALLTAAKLPALLVTDPIHIKYLLGKEADGGLLLVLPKRYVYFTHLPFLTYPAKLIERGIEVKPMDAFEKMMRTLDACGYEADEVSVTRFAGWKKKFKSVTFVRTAGVIQEYRRSKDDDELRLIRRAKKITRELLRRVPGSLRTSITEQKLARQLQMWALELGAEGMAFPTIVAFGSNTAHVHHMPTTRVLKKGHLVQIDVGAKFDGYCSDASQVFFTAAPTREERRVYEALNEAARAAERLAKPGASTRALDEAARAVLRREHLEEKFCHSLGHGVGLEIHEGVSLSSRAPDQKILKREVITIEPGVYFPGKFGMRVEDTYIME